MELLVTENKSTGYLTCINNRYNCVRIFIQGNYDYGYWIDEKLLFSLLSSDQQKQYLNGDSYSDGIFDISKDVAQKLLDEGQTPYHKQVLYD